MSALCKTKILLSVNKAHRKRKYKNVISV